jgi:hypothetical protein
LDLKIKRVIVHDGVGHSFWLNPNRDPAQIDVYTGGGLRWSDVSVPEGLQVIDERLEAHGFTLADGIVLEGQVVDLAIQRPIAARMRLQRVEPQPKGGYQYTVMAEAVADTQGRWVLKQAPAGWHRVAPAKEVALRMMKSARVRVTVDFTGRDRQLSFDDVPPGRYVLHGQPNPSAANQQTEPLTIELKGGQTAEVKLSAQ